MKRAIMMVEKNTGGWFVQAGYVVSATTSKTLSAPSRTDVVWALGSPRTFLCEADVDWSTVPGPMQVRDVAPGVIEP